MFVIERSGVTWGERFYVGHNYMTNTPSWGPLNYAVEYHNKSRAVSMSYRIDDEEGIYTTIENVEDFPNQEE
jgi:hypothetical protein